MADGVPEVQHRASATLLALVLRDHGGLVPRARGDHRHEHGGIEPDEVIDPLLEPREELRVADGRVLDDLRRARDELATRQRGERADVGEHEPGLVERPDEVLAAHVVDARLPADRRVDLREQRRRHERARQTAQQRRGREARGVADHLCLDPERLFLRREGAVPGPRNGYVVILKAKKPPRERRGFAGSTTLDPLKAAKKAAAGKSKK